MAVQNPFFGRRDPEPFQPRTGSGTGTVPSSLSNAAPGASAGMGLSQSTASAAGASAAAQAPAESSGSKLTVGPNIKLRGVEITDCDTLVVEGTVEATMDSRVIQIAEQGAFRGAADIDLAEIRGTFDGTLNVREKLTVFSTGKVTGKIRCGRLVVEEGGQLSGDIEMGAGQAGALPAGAAAQPARHSGNGNGNGNGSSNHNSSSPGAVAAGPDGSSPASAAATA